MQTGCVLLWCTRKLYSDQARVIKVLKWTITVMLTMFVDATKVTVYFKKSFLFCHSTALEPNT